MGTRLTLLLGALILLGTGAATWLLGRSLYATLAERKQAELAEHSELISEMVAVYVTSLEHEMDRQVRLLGAFLPPDYSLDATRSLDVAGHATPTLRAGTIVLNNHLETVDKYTEASGVIATIFARSGSDFVRVTTSLKNESGKRAMGTVLDRSHPAYPLLVRGEPYVGPAVLFGRSYITKYLPVRSAAGEVIAVLFVGSDMTDELADLRRRLRSLHVGATGRVIVVDAHEGPTKGKFIVHPTREGEAGLKLVSKDGISFVQEMVSKKQGTIRYVVSDQDGSGDREQVAVFSPFAKWGWVIATSIESSELTAVAQATAGKVLFGGLTGGALLLAWLAWTIRQTVTRPVRLAAAAARKLASGDLSAVSEKRSNDEFGDLLSALDETVARLRVVLGAVNRRSNELAVASAQMSSTATALADGASRQVSGVAEWSSSVQKLTFTVNQNAEHARATDAIAVRAAREAHEGSRTVREATQVMRTISEQTGAVADLAERTDLLAINAELEAVRAGEHGKGFALVAAQVRTLALRSGTATVDIRKLAADSEQRADKARAIVDAMLPSIAETSTLVQKIAALSQQQADEVAVVSGSIQDMSRAAVNNAGAAQQLAATAAELRAVAEDLRQRVSFFQMDGAAGEGRSDTARETASA